MTRYVGHMNTSSYDRQSGTLNLAQISSCPNFFVSFFYSPCPHGDFASSRWLEKMFGRREGKRGKGGSKDLAKTSRKWPENLGCWGKWTVWMSR